MIPLDRLQAPFRDDLSPAITGRWHPRPINQTVGSAQLGELPSVAIKRRIRHRRRAACPVRFGFISRVAFGEIDRAPARWRDVIQQLLEQCVRCSHHHRVVPALVGVGEANIMTRSIGPRQMRYRLLSPAANVSVTQDSLRPDGMQRRPGRTAQTATRRMFCR
jgi:hypothetical protein